MADLTQFQEALAFVLKWEGGYTNDPVDPGGATNLGIIQSEYDSWRTEHGLPHQSVRAITLAEATTIYSAEYWGPCHAPDVAWPLSLVLFDTAVNMGVGRAIRFAQRAAGVNADGAWGPVTTKAVLSANQKALAIAICDMRIAFRHARVNDAPSQVRFLNGWLNRDHAVKSAAGG